MLTNMGQNAAWKCEPLSFCWALDKLQTQYLFGLHVNVNLNQEVA